MRGVLPTLTRLQIARGLLAAVVLGTGIVLAIIAAGLPDPVPAGELVYAGGCDPACALPVPGTIEVTLAPAEGPHGLAWPGAEWTINPSGLLTIRQGGAITHEIAHYPHIRPGEANRLRLDAAAGTVTLWLNDETVTTLTPGLTGPVRVEPVGAAVIGARVWASRPQALD
ncbi:MAG: hypothetical protein ACFB51_19840 [Anaerolineae bacterium]